MIDAEETFEGTWPFAPFFFGGCGFKQHYVIEGGGSPILLLHGEPTWGYLYRHFIPALAPYRGQLSNVFVTVAGLVAISGILFTLVS